ncbi:MAG: hypothetical protein Q9213_000762 [Squamulea squamosa]
MHTSTFLGAVLTAGSLFCSSSAQVTTECDPTKVTCPNDQGLATDTYSIDFTKTKTLPAEWQLANYANVGLGDQGAEFTFAKRYDAPTMWTKFKFFFGRVEFVVKAAPGVGIVSSMVLLSDDLDEIDWEFLGGVTTNVQTNYFGKGSTGTYNRSTSPAVASPQTQFHTYALDWSTAALTWSIDGVVVRTLNAKDADGNGDQYPQSPMKVSLSLWDAGDPDSPTQGWGGGVTPIPPPEPYTMYVKSVRIFNQNPAQQYQYTDKSGSWKSIKVINDVPFSSSSSVAPTQGTTLSLGFTSAVSSSQSSQASAVASSLSSKATTSTSAASTPLPSSALFSSSQSAVSASRATSGTSTFGSYVSSAAASSAPNRAATADIPSSANSHPVITVSSTLTATITSCSSKSDCPTNSNQGSSITTPAASVGSNSESTTHLTSTVTQGTQTYTSTLPSSAGGSSSTTAAWTSSSASVALSSKTMTPSPYPPSSTTSIKNLNQSPSVNASSASSYQSSSTAIVASWSSSASWSSAATMSIPKMTPIANVSSANLQQSISTGMVDSWSSSASSYGIGTASAKVSTIGSLTFTDLIPAASTATVTSVTTASCSDKSSNLGLLPPAAGSSSLTPWPLSSYPFTSVSIMSTRTGASNNWTSTTSTWVSPSTLSSSWASKQAPSGSSALVSTLATSPSIILIPLAPILPSAKPSTSNPLPTQATSITTSSSSLSWAKPPTANPPAQNTPPAPAPSALVSTQATSPSTVLIALTPLLKSQIASSSATAATLDTKSVITVGSLTAWGFTSAPEATTTSVDTATVSSTATAFRSQLTPPRAPGYPSENWNGGNGEMARAPGIKHPSATTSQASKLVTSVGPKASSLVSPIGNDNGTPTDTDADIISIHENDDNETETDKSDNLGPQTTAPPWSGVGKTNWADDMNVPWDESGNDDDNNQWDNAPEYSSAWSSVTSVGPKVASTPQPSYARPNSTSVSGNWKPSIASTGGWTTPSGVAGTTGKTVPFKGEGGRVEMGTESSALMMMVVALMVLV